MNKANLKYNTDDNKLYGSEIDDQYKISNLKMRSKKRINAPRGQMSARIQILCKKGMMRHGPTIKAITRGGVVCNLHFCRPQGNWLRQNRQKQKGRRAFLKAKGSPPPPPGGGRSGSSPASSQQVLPSSGTPPTNLSLMKILYQWSGGGAGIFG